MTPTAEKIEKEIQRLPREDKLALAERLSAMLESDRPLPGRVKVGSVRELDAEILKGVESPSSPMTESDWQSLRDRITRHETSGA